MGYCRAQAGESGPGGAEGWRNIRVGEGMVDDGAGSGEAGMVAAITLLPQQLRAAGCRDVTDQELRGRFRELED